MFVDDKVCVSIGETETSTKVNIEPKVISNVKPLTVKLNRLTPIQIEGLPKQVLLLNIVKLTKYLWIPRCDLTHILC